MDFYNQLIKIKTWKNLLEFLEIMNLQILKTNISFIDWLRKLLGLSYNAKVIIGNNIVTYILDVSFLEANNEIFIKITNIEII